MSLLGVFSERLLASRHPHDNLVSAQLCPAATVRGLLFGQAAGDVLVCALRSLAAAPDYVLVWFIPDGSSELLIGMAERHGPHEFELFEPALAVDDLADPGSLPRLRESLRRLKVRF